MEAWREWNKHTSHRKTDVPGVGVVENWVDTIDIDGPLVSFRWTYVFESDGAVLTSDSTLRFRTKDESRGCSLMPALSSKRYAMLPDRPDREFVFIGHSGGS